MKRILMGFILGGSFSSVVACADLATNAQFYQQRYGLSDTYSKAVDDEGNGDASLYGTRNFRTVLYGVHYRGGANNAYLKPTARANSNPLPDVGLTDLCQEGFGLAIYLYSTNYSTAPHTVTCKSVRGGSNTLQYVQINPFTTDGINQILNYIYTTIQTYQYGPIYTHCWNGWHASGYVSAIALRQFCGASGAEAQAYWTKDTDGQPVNTAPTILQMINSFVPNPNMTLSPAVQKELCPQIISS